jgi:hypothetical protein
VNPDHLFLGTKGDNARDMANKNRAARGEKHGMVRLLEADAIDIITLFGQGALRRDLAIAYGVSRGCVDGIIDGRNWRHLGLAK